MKILDETRRTGGCQCGALRFEAGAILDNPHVCHCRMCQRATGNFFAPFVGVPNHRLAWTRGEAAVFESSEGIERGFCRDCGTPLFYRPAGGGHTSVMIGAFDHPAEIPVFYELGTESRAPQLDALGHVKSYATEAKLADRVGHIARTNRQFQPD